jgi:hypothetical protein
MPYPQNRNLQATPRIGGSVTFGPGGVSGSVNIGVGGGGNDRGSVVVPAPVTGPSTSTPSQAGLLSGTTGLAILGGLAYLALK